MSVVIVSGLRPVKTEDAIFADEFTVAGVAAVCVGTCSVVVALVVYVVTLVYVNAVAADEFKADWANAVVGAGGVAAGEVGATRVKFHFAFVDVVAVAVDQVVACFLAARKCKANSSVLVVAFDIDPLAVVVSDGVVAIGPAVVAWI